MKRFLFNLVAMTVAMTLWSPQVAVAQTGYTWTDISGQLTERQNRPVWAVARAGSYWFYTDGQDLWNGGQVYRYDGSTQVNITSDVRNAGLTRIDDIVSDGQSVLFLKNVVRRDNSFEILKWNSSGYIGVGSYVRNTFASDEGIRSIVGRAGTWYIVSTKNRLYRWNAGQESPVRVALPSEAVNDANTKFLYQMNHTMVDSPTEVGIVPIANGNWLLMTRANFGTYGTIAFYRYNGTSYTYLSELATQYVTFLASNGTDALLYSTAGGACVSGSIHRTNGMTNEGISLPSGYSDYSNCNVNPTTSKIVLDDSMAFWNGLSWMILQGKSIYKITDRNLTVLEPTRDYLTSASGDTSGHFLVGGAQSDVGVNSPTNPLTAKLLWVTEGELSTNTTVTTGGSFGGDRVYTSTNGPRVVIQGDPSGFRVGNGKEFSYRVTASDSDGVDRTDLYVNDARIKTCYSDTCEFRTTYWTNGATTKTVKFWVRSTDKRGQSTDTSASPDFLTVDVNSTATAGGTVTTTPTTSVTTGSGTAVTDSGTGISSWTWLDPTGKTNLNANESVTYNVGAYDNDGIKRIEIFVNGLAKKTCDLGNAKGNQTCGVTLYANDYPVGTGIYVNAKVTDGADKYTYTTATTLYRNAEGTSVPSGSTATTNQVSTWTWFDPAGELKSGASTIFRSGAWAQDGLASIDLYVNGSLKRTCSFNRSYGNQECSITVYGNDYALGTQVAANTKATDVNGKTSWSDLKYVNQVSSNSTSGSSYSGTNSNPVVWDWIEIAKDFITVDEKAKYVTGAWDENGVSSIAFYVNGNVKATSNLGTAYGNQSTSYEVRGLDYPVGSTVFVNAKVTDATGKETWTAGKTFRVMGTGATTSIDYAKNGSVQAWTDRAVYSTTNMITVNGSVSDEDGVNRIEILVNGELKKTCTVGNVRSASCAVTVGPYPSLSSVKYAVTMFDRYGNMTTSGYLTVAIVK
ncbi:hypothetical protein A3E39_03615 [Candidatus Uhrbacteria bacterium RIFCSPHIGHO2_12_FULL_60_25]|uniref:Uncharacterized protein n=1 Tax=Candidatus Uhrbacteria bacterium RIFCSPHIGHO2_12_FULL_60_25 TaxID=1802399 RepID=A0A1F7UMT0_9BACT|nr:MAG: hypothetical protein A3D73_03775 [Candidatus Uhrbacteria bacterium RIFCSPHIGHO2_02_FULL_60_44]OGL79008.1 MAG: hypothetical protein A3E39_03615 [Candidatus Uhrbacteria bacterium RIFCSPHIGHO2_12_FULL_60_25]